MGKVTWGGGVSASDLDDAERSQFKPYDGPTVPNGMYAFRVKVLKRGKAKSSGNPQLIIGLELAPRKSRPDEKKYKGYFLTEYISVVDSQAWKLAPFLDAIGVSGADFVNRTTDDGEKDDRGSVKITKIGKWINDGKTFVLATIGDDSNQDGTPRKRVTNFWPVEEAMASKATEDDDDADDEDDEDEDDAPPPRKAAKKTAKKRQPEPEPDEDDADDEDEDDTPPPPRKKAAKKAVKKRKAPEPEEDDDDADDEDDEDEDAPF